MSAVLFTASEAAQSLGITPRTFRRWDVVPAAERDGAKLYSAGAILDNRLAAMSRKRRRPDTTAAQLKSEISGLQTELDRARAAGQALANAQSRGELVRLDQLTQAIARACAAAGARLDTLPGKIKRKLPALNFSDIHRIRAALAEAMNQAADSRIDWTQAPRPDHEQ